MSDESRIARRRRAATEEGAEEFTRRRAELIEAAGAAFTEVGYEQATFSEIGRRVGMKRAAVYYYFSSKEELLQEVIHETIAANLARIREIARSDASASERLRAAVVDMMGSYARNYPHQYLYVRSDVDRLRVVGDPKTQEILGLASAYVDEIVGIVEDGLTAGELRPLASAEVLGYAVVGMVNWTYRWYRPGSPTSGEELGNVFAELALGGLLESPPDA